MSGGAPARVAAALAAWLTCGFIAAVQAQSAGVAAEAPAATLSIGRNVQVAGGSVRTNGAVAGDFTAFGGRVAVDHAVGADATLAGGSVEVRAPVGDDLRVAGGDVNIASAVGGELYAAGGNVALAGSGSVARDASLAGGSVTIDGRIAGRLRVAARHIVINGEVAGDAWLRAERIDLGPGAKIGGALSYRSTLPLRQAEGATVAGGAVAEDADLDDDRHTGMHSGDMPGMSAPFWFASTFGFVGLLAVAALFALLLPGFSARVADAVGRSPWRAIGLGVATLVALPLLALLLVLTLLGIPLGIAVMAAYPLLWLLGFVAGVLFVAQRIRTVSRAGAPASSAATIGFVALALLLVMLLGWLPFVGWLALLALTVAGLGACVLELVRGRRATVV